MERKGYVLWKSELSKEKILELFVEIFQFRNVKQISSKNERYMFVLLSKILNKLILLTFHLDKIIVNQFVKQKARGFLFFVRKIHQ